MGFLPNPQPASSGLFHMEALVATVFLAPESKPFGGSVSAFIRKAGKRQSTNVNCGSCSACCTTPNLSIQISEDEALRLDHTVRDDGLVLLARKEDGSCKYHIEGQCSIYASRPRVCRGYDCRIHALLGLAPPDGPMRQVILHWAPPNINTADDAVLYLAMRMASASAMEDAAGDESYVTMTRRAFDRLPDEIQRARTLRDGSDTNSILELAKILGIMTKAKSTRQWK